MKFRVLAVLLVLGLFVAACGDDDADTTTTAAGTTTAGGTDYSQEIADLTATLEQNLYYQALQQSGQTMNTYPGEAYAADAPIRIVFSIEGLSHPFLVGQTEAATAACEELGCTVEIISAEDDINKQYDDVQTALGTQPDALMMMPANTEGLAPLLAQYDDAGIPYFFAQKGMLGVNPASQVLAAYAAEGKAIGEFVVEQFGDSPEPLQVGVIEGIAGDVSSVARSGAFKLELLKNGNFEIVASQPGEYRREPSQRVMEGFLAAHPDIDIVFGANDEAALGALAALRAAGIPDGQITIVAIDGETDMFPEVQKGAVLATFTHALTAGIVVEEIVAYLRGEPVPAFLVSPGELVTKAKIDAGEVEPAF
jgi:ribose transport system substrate-binding protein